MATYKVIQDIEAEDKLVGPLTLRQFIYGCIAAVCGYMSFIALTKGFAFVLVVLGPVMLFTGFFAFPWGRDQPTEVWALAKIRFFLKSRKRLWDQSGVKDLVTVTAPKHAEVSYTNGLQPHEVESRLTALASMLDSRGWAVKNVTGPYTPSLNTASPSSERLMDIAAMPQQVQAVGITDADDILDAEHNAQAHRLEEMVAASSTNRRSKLMNQLKQATAAAAAPILPKPAATPSQGQRPPADYWFLNKPVDQPQLSRGNTVFSDAQVVHAGDTDTNDAVPNVGEKTLAEQLRLNREKSQMGIGNTHLKTIQPLGAQAAQSATTTPPATPNPAPVIAPVTPASNPATMNLYRRDDLNISTLANMANQKKDDGEVVISLHNH